MLRSGHAHSDGSVDMCNHASVVEVVRSGSRRAWIHGCIRLPVCMCWCGGSIGASTFVWLWPRPLTQTLSQPRARTVSQRVSLCATIVVNVYVWWV